MDSRRSQAQATRQLKIMQDQAGHATASSTAIYTGVSDEYRNQLLRRKLTERHASLWENDES